MSEAKESKIRESKTPKTNVSSSNERVFGSSSVPGLNTDGTRRPQVVPQQFQSNSASIIIAYVHDLSLVRHNKTNTVDYATLTLQTSENITEPAICYSKAKRKLLEEKETTRSPIKLGVLPNLSLQRSYKDRYK